MFAADDGLALADHNGLATKAFTQSTRERRPKQDAQAKRLPGDADAGKPLARPCRALWKPAGYAG